MKKSTQRIYLFFNKKKKKNPVNSRGVTIHSPREKKKKKKKKKKKERKKERKKEEGRKHKHENMPWIQTLILSFHLKLKA